MATRIAIHGASGRLGQLIAQEAGVSFVGSVERGGPIPDCDVVIDVSSPGGLDSLMERLSGQPLLIGTTGALPMAKIESYGATAPVALIANFSAGVPLLLKLIQQAVASMPSEWRVEIVESHHDQKKDAPSGTARRMVRAVEEAGGPSNPPTHAIRAGDTIGEHTIWLAGPGERIEIKHVATQRAVFALGALRWADWLKSQPAGVYTP
jgi:4-hydroxy-tetrahydrodipicolinate reductase